MGLKWLCEVLTFNKWFTTVSQIVNYGIWSHVSPKIAHAILRVKYFLNHVSGYPRFHRTYRPWQQTLFFEED